MRVHYPTNEWWISNTAIRYYKNQWSEIKWIGWKYDTASEEALTSVHYDGLQIPSVENQSQWPSHHHQSTKHKKLISNQLFTSKANEEADKTFSI